MLEAATRAVDCIWERGLLKKGTGVCHGVSGSMLGILSLYRFTNEERLLYRAFRMCEVCLCELVLVFFFFFFFFWGG